MALGKKRIVAQKSNSRNRRDIDNGGLGLGFEFSQYKKEFGRKRSLKSSVCMIKDSIFSSPLSNLSSKKLCDRTCVVEGHQSQQLEDFPYDILVKIICGVEHEDLKKLFQVSSKTIRKATIAAKESHFAYNTPRKTSVFDNGRIGFGIEDNDNDDIDAPGAPLQKRNRLSRLNCNKDYSGVAVALFH